MATKQTWQVLLDDENWADDVSLDPFAQNEERSDLGQRQRSMAWLGAVLVICLTAGLGGLYFWQAALAGLNQAEAELADALVLEELARQAGDEDLALALLDSTANETWQARLRSEIQSEAQRDGAAWPVQTEIAWMDLRDDLALVQLRVDDPARPFPYRETRFYRQAEAGWLQTEPDPIFWGSEQTLESAYFRFQFRHKDLPAVAEAAPRLDALYEKMHRLLGLPLGPLAEKIEVELVVDAGPVTKLFATQNQWPLRVNAPGLLPVPQHLSEADVLVEAVALPLRRERILTSVPSAARYRLSTELLSGLRMWLAWETGSWQAERRAERVRWLYSSAPAGPEQLPDDWAESCQMAWVWHLSVTAIPFPYYCTGQILLLPQMQPATRLAHLPLSVDLVAAAYEGTSETSNERRMENRQGQAITIATVLEYVASAYGWESVPLLIAASQQSDSWQEVIPQSLGVSCEEFETGWRNWLVQTYQVDATAFVR